MDGGKGTLLFVAYIFKLWWQITMTAGLQNIVPAAKYLDTWADMFMLSSPSFSLCQMPGYLVSMAAKSGTSDTSKMMEQNLTPRLSDQVIVDHLDINGLLGQCKQYRYKAET